MVNRPQWCSIDHCTDFSVPFILQGNVFAALIQDQSEEEKEEDEHPPKPAKPEKNRINKVKVVALQVALIPCNTFWPWCSNSLAYFPAF